MNRRLFAALLPVVGLAALGLWGCGRAADPWAGESGLPKVVVTIPPLYSFVRAVAGKEGAVRCICTTTGPHHYETDRRDARLLQKADILFGVGLGLDERFSNSMLTLSQRKDLPYVKLGDKLPEKLKLNLREDDDDHKEGEKAGEHHHHEHGKYDPHVWLGVPQAIAMVEMIRDELSKIDESHKADYEKNAKAYIEGLKKLQSNEPAGIAGKKIISFHDSLQYFAKSFKFDIAEVIELLPGAEPGPTHLSRLVAVCKKEKVRVIAVEPQYPSSTSAANLQQDLKREGISVQLAPVDPLETADANELKKEGADWYTSRMKKNLTELASKLK
jgi:zinc transport system substrate-binding protein